MNNALPRRDFLKFSASIAAGTSLALSAAAPVFAVPGLNRAMPPLTIRPQQKALVFIMLDGGNDSYNMLVPTDERRYRDYRNTRSNLALSRHQLLPLQGMPYGLHPAIPEIQKLFNQNKLSFIANIGPLIEPVSKQRYMNGSALLPLGLMSHADQFKHWQTSRPGERLNRGWFGYFADVLQRDKAADQVSMNISLAGSNIMQNGVVSRQYAIKHSGSVGLEISERPTPLNRAIEASFETLLNTQYPHDPFKQTYLAITREAQAQHEVFRKATNPAQVNTHFSSSELSQQLKMVARAIHSAERLGMAQQTFFIRYIGWDHHDELLNNQARMLGVLSKALGEFQAALTELGVANRVVTFTGSDFGRTLTSNGNGSDHGWGGNILVMGEAINGGEIFGKYPSLQLGHSNPLDAGDGVLIPTTATDQLYAELSMWFGVNKRDLSVLFPNLRNFYDVTGADAPLGLFT